MLHWTSALSPLFLLLLRPNNGSVALFNVVRENETIHRVFSIEPAARTNALAATAVRVRTVGARLMTTLPPHRLLWPMLALPALVALVS